MESRIEIRPGRTINITTYQHPNPKGTVFLIHGLGGKSTQFREQIPFLKEKYTLILPDLYGHRHSDAPLPEQTNPYSFAEISQDLQAMFDQFASDNNIIIGHSYGGAFSAYLCLKRQDHVSKLVLISPTAINRSIQVPLVYRLPLFFVEMLRPLLEKQFAKLAFNKTQNQDLIQTEIQSSRTVPLYVIKSLIVGMNTIPTVDISTLKTPTLFIMGMNDLLVPTSHQEAFYRNIPNLTECRFNDAAHLVLLEKPQETNQAIKTFLGE